MTSTRMSSGTHSCTIIYPFAAQSFKYEFLRKKASQVNKIAAFSTLSWNLHTTKLLHICFIPNICMHTTRHLLVTLVPLTSAIYHCGECWKPVLQAQFLDHSSTCLCSLVLAMQDFAAPLLDGTAIPMKMELLYILPKVAYILVERMF